MVFQEENLRWKILICANAICTKFQSLTDGLQSKTRALHIRVCNFLSLDSEFQPVVRVTCAFGITYHFQVSLRTRPSRACTLQTDGALIRHRVVFCTRPPVCLGLLCPYRSAHTRLIDPAINDALRIVTGCLHPTPADNLPILAGIQPAELRCNGATLSLGRRAIEPGHLQQSRIWEQHGTHRISRR